MSPDEIDALADRADPDELWRLPLFPKSDFKPGEYDKLMTGVLLRRYAHQQRRLLELLKEKRSLLITPLGTNSTATKAVDTPPEHERLRHG